MQIIERVLEKMHLPQDIQIRPARPEDLAAIYALMAEFDMFGRLDAAGCVVALLDDAIGGFARIEVADERSYLRPIVVARQYQGQGVGTALLECIVAQTVCLTVIARGSAVPFYIRAGFIPTDWDEIYLPFRQECISCPDLGVCCPVPLVFAAG